jgi:hypothetical protein
VNPETTRKLTSRTDSDDPYGGNSCWETPPEVFAKLNADFGPFDLDMTADAKNHLLPDWVGPGSPLGADILAVLDLVNHDGFGISAKSGYSNPIYDYKFINALVPLCAFAARKKGFASTLLLPLRTTSDWWNWLITNQHNEDGAAVIAFCDKRICFYEGGEPRWNAKELAKGNYRPDSAVFDSVVIHFSAAPPAGLDVSTCFRVWQVPPHVPRIYREVL